MNTRWTVEQAQDWYARHDWLLGVNFVPSTAANTTEFWQAESFDAEAIDRELGTAAATGFNSVRVFLQFLVWKTQRDAFLDNFKHFLMIAEQHKVSVMVCLFDDCAFGQPILSAPVMGKQRDLIPGMIASNWTPSPGLAEVTDKAAWPELEHYITDMVGQFRADPRIVIWDLYNEPGNSKMGSKSLPLLRETFAWARAAQPTQPLTAGVWHNDLKELNDAQLELSDITTFHFYGKHEDLKTRIAHYKSLGRPVICTEWMARLLGSRWDTDLPLFQTEQVGCYSWGLVNGRMQCQFPWWNKPGDEVHEKWFHDLYHTDGKPYDPTEIEVIRGAGARKSATRPSK